MSRTSWFDRNRWRYPVDWPDIAQRIKTAAGWRCEACDAPHSASPHVLTVDHLDHDPANCANENLIALCQRCHLRRQGLRPQPATKADAIRRLGERARLERGQLALAFDDSALRTQEVAHVQQ